MLEQLRTLSDHIAANIAAVEHIHNFAVAGRMILAELVRYKSSRHGLARPVGLMKWKDRY